MDNKVNFKIFTWAIGLIMVVIAWVLTSQCNTNKRVDAIESSFSEISVDIGTIKNDISWIKNTINKTNATAKQ